MWCAQTEVEHKIGTGERKLAGSSVMTYIATSTRVPIRSQQLRQHSRNTVSCPLVSYPGRSVPTPRAPPGEGGVWGRTTRLVTNSGRSK